MYMLCAFVCLQVVSLIAVLVFVFVCVCCREAFFCDCVGTCCACCLATVLVALFQVSHAFLFHVSLVSVYCVFGVHVLCFWCACIVLFGVVLPQHEKCATREANLRESSHMPPPFKQYAYMHVCSCVYVCACVRAFTTTHQHNNTYTLADYVVTFLDRHNDLCGRRRRLCQGRGAHQSRCSAIQQGAGDGICSDRWPSGLVCAPLRLRMCCRNTVTPNRERSPHTAMTILCVSRMCIHSNNNSSFCPGRAHTALLVIPCVFRMCAAITILCVFTS